ncbi:sulfite exporter TauE/SafE family protein [Roseobacter denitrificans]|uniref:Probable membrane transporter protein n=1 Tax=Roseobacter denitrificans (strain ATCC 33942 / OCh 114) TaxID=375451 RepID=Q165A7_ROSDO|nr:sulfite exporter TauE/SafE family protein [Roseobacter denitrificans]ABG32436.1 integral membrane protein, putative [Roseobacter denitrificans OCh 114]AVL51899.1 sulfite exporter TauE/SafE family protein [Roseobacter denitrificans]SFF81793.1 hypothetical protein SAMN05443635_102404 [Roseobacter denitrificans OCh 114]
MTGEQILFIVLGAAAGGFINGLAAFGTALFALGFFLSVMTPVQAVTLTVTLSIFSGLQGLWVVRHAMLDNTARLARFIIPGCLGVPLGVWSLHLIDVSLLKLVIAFFLILYGGYFTWRSNLPKIRAKTPVIDATVGFSGGVLGGAASLSGALPTMWCSIRGWPKMETRAVLQPYNMVILTCAAVMLGLRGAYTSQTLGFLALAIPVSILAAQTGMMVFRRISDVFFRKLLISLTLVSGCALLIREIL